MFRLASDLRDDLPHSFVLRHRAARTLRKLVDWLHRHQNPIFGESPAPWRQVALALLYAAISQGGGLGTLAKSLVIVALVTACRWNTRHSVAAHAVVQKYRADVMSAGFSDRPPLHQSISAHRDGVEDHLDANHRRLLDRRHLRFGQGGRPYVES